MGKILTLGQASGRQNFGVSLAGNNGIDISFNGEPEVIVQMLYDAMNFNEHIAKTIITTVIIFADQKRIPLDELQKKHSYIPDGKIVVSGLNNQV